jgi:hypothetical protein
MWCMRCFKYQKNLTKNKNWYDISNQKIDKDLDLLKLVKRLKTYKLMTKIFLSRLQRDVVKTILTPDK